MMMSTTIVIVSTTMMTMMTTIHTARNVPGKVTDKILRMEESSLGTMLEHPDTMNTLAEGGITGALGEQAVLLADVADARLLLCCCCGNCCCCSWSCRWVLVVSMMMSTIMIVSTIMMTIMTAIHTARNIPGKVTDKVFRMEESSLGAMLEHPDTVDALAEGGVTGALGEQAVLSAEVADARLLLGYCCCCYCCCC